MTSNGWGGIGEPWAAFALSLHTNPKLAAANVEAPGATGFYVCAVLWSLTHGTRGFVPDQLLGSVQAGVEPRQARSYVKALDTHGRLERVPGGWMVHHFGLHQAPAVELLERRRAERDRKRRQRAAQRADGDA